MKRQITFAIFLISSFGAFAQGVTKEDLDKEIKPLTEKVNSLQSENRKLKSEIRTLNSKLSIVNKNIDSLRINTKDNINAITQTAKQLGIQIKETGDKNEGKITEVYASLSKNSLYGIIGVLSAILLSGLLYWLLSKRQQTDKTDFIDKLSKTKSSIEESLVKEYTRESYNQKTATLQLPLKRLILTERQHSKLQRQGVGNDDLLVRVFCCSYRVRSHFYQNLWSKLLLCHIRHKIIKYGL